MKAYNVVKRALGLVGIRAFGEALDPNAAQEAVEYLGDMLGEWSSKSLYNPNFTTQSVTSSGKSVYTMGPDALGTPGDFASNVADILACTVTMGTTVWDMVLRGAEEYNQVFPKTVQGVPRYCYWDRQYPQSSLHFWPIPVSGYTIQILGNVAINRPATVQDEINLPDDYSEALVYGLAFRLIPMFPGACTAESAEIIRQTADRALSGIKRRNSDMRQTHMVSDFQPGSSAPRSWWTWAGRTV